MLLGRFVSKLSLNRRKNIIMDVIATTIQYEQNSKMATGLASPQEDNCNVPTISESIQCKLLSF